jgi:hypothetical protein
VPPEVRAEVKAILYFGPEAARDAGSFEPADSAHFGVTVQILIGETGDDLADSFDVIVCSPSWFAVEAANGRWFTQGAPLGMPEAVAVGSGMWFMRRWNRRDFETAIGFLCDTYSPGPDWGSVAARIGRQIPWEYDYKHDSHINAHFGSPFPPRRESWHRSADL